MRNLVCQRDIGVGVEGETADGLFRKDRVEVCARRATNEL